MHARLRRQPFVAPKAVALVFRASDDVVFVSPHAIPASTSAKHCVSMTGFPRSWDPPTGVDGKDAKSDVKYLEKIDPMLDKDPFRRCRDILCNKQCA